jgi:beta-mannosidase
MDGDLLSSAAWECCSTRPGLATDPADLASHAVDWIAATVPGTAAGALRAAGSGDVSGRDYDNEDWWFRCRFAPDDRAASATSDWVLDVEGLATIADVWLNGQLLLHSENMFVAHAVAVPALAAENELVIRCAAFAPILDQRRPRPRWKTYLVSNQHLRWFRTTLLGRLPGWARTPVTVGPWRPVRLTASPVRVLTRRVVARCDGDDGIVELSLRLRAPRVTATTAVVRVGDVSVETPVARDDDDLLVDLEVRVPSVSRWWPHTHGEQPRYALSVDLGEHHVALGRVGFRAVEVDRTDGAFSVSVNGVSVFCRGACWMPPDAVTMAAAPDVVRATLELARAAHMNMVRVAGTTVYPDAAFWDACDELGILVWQDCMFAFMDPPDDDDFVEGVRHELTQNLGALGGRPALALVCGSQEVEEIPAMMGLPRERWTFPFFEKTIPAIVDDLLPGIPYVTSNPTGGDLPFQMDTGVSQYFGVGGYLRTIGDVRRDHVRFAAECLAFATPPERATVDAVCGGATRAGHDPVWKLGVHHDAGRSWDMDDVRDYYVHELFAVDALHERYIDPEHALDLGRAANAELMAQVFTEWRRPGSGCGGGLVLALRDLREGAGWGVIDSGGLPKAPYYALRRVMQPIAVLVTDEGLNGLHAHLVNDTATAFAGSVRCELFARGERSVDTGSRDVEIPARGSRMVDLGELFDGFRDISYAYRFSPPAHDVVAVTLTGLDGTVASEAIHLPLGLSRPLEAEIGLSATAAPSNRPETGTATGAWTVSVTTRRFAQSVALDVAGFVPTDSWFHLAPGATRSLTLVPLPGSEDARPRGSVRAVNARAESSLRIDG